MITYRSEQTFYQETFGLELVGKDDSSHYSLLMDIPYSKIEENDSY